MSDQAKRQYDEMQESFRQQKLGEQGIETGGHIANQRGLDDYNARQAQEERRRETARELERAQQQREADARAARNRQQQTKAKQQKAAQKTASSSSSGQKDGFDVLIGLAGAGAGAFLADQGGATEFLQYAIPAAIGGAITYALSGLIKVLLAIGIVGGIIYFIATNQG